MEEIHAQTSSGDKKAIPRVETDKESDGGGDGTSDGNGKADKNNRSGSKVLLNMLECVDAVHQLTGLNWEEIYRIAAVDFISYTNFWNYKQRKEQKAMDDFKRKNKIK